MAHESLWVRTHNNKTEEKYVVRADILSSTLTEILGWIDLSILQWQAWSCAIKDLVKRVNMT
jgi:hypothetical protein